ANQKVQQQVPNNQPRAEGENFPF
ncbi:single-stranded DNA-binding protein, partial [Escherichia coli]|nr:single-stranded DNA-binding protein [Escherichia coli]